MNVLTDNGAKTFFPREECIVHNCNLSPSFSSTLHTALLIELFLRVIQGGKHLTVATSTVTEM